MSGDGYGWTTYRAVGRFMAVIFFMGLINMLVAAWHQPTFQGTLIAVGCALGGCLYFAMAESKGGSEPWPPQPGGGK